MEDSAQAALADLRELVARRFSANFECVRKAAAPLSPNTDNDALLAGIVDAVAWCLYLHALDPSKRPADNRKALLRVRSHAEIVAAKLDDLVASLNQLFPWSRDLVSKHWKLVSGNNDPATLLEAGGLVTRALASIAAQHADSFRSADRGGRPQLTVFKVLIEGLARGYENATARRPTVTTDPISNRHGGPFVRLVDAVVPTVTELAPLLSGRALERPASDHARGQLIRELLRRRRKVENPTEPPPR
jgi:hypothetical protein